MLNAHDANCGVRRRRSQALWNLNARIGSLVLIRLGFSLRFRGWRGDCGG